MLDSELNSHDTDNNDKGHANSGQEPATVPAAPAVPAAVFQPPQVLFQPPAPVAVPPAAGRDSGGRDRGDGPGGEPGTDSEAGRGGRRTSRGTRGTRGSRPARGAGASGAPDDDLFSTGGTEAADADRDTHAAGSPVSAGPAADGEADEGPATRRRRRRSTRGRGRLETAESAEAGAEAQAVQAAAGADASDDDEAEEAEGPGAGLGEAGVSGRRRRRKRRRGSADTDVSSPDDPPDTVVHVREAHHPADDVRAIKGSTRLEAKKQRRREGRESGRRRPPVITESEFLARRESVERMMVVRQRGDRTQIAVLEDGVLVEHYVNRTTHQSYVGNVYLGKVQNVLPSMEAAFVDIGKGRNAVLYAGEVNFDASGLEGQPKRIESALKPGQSVIVQVTKDPVGHKGARLTSLVSLPGRYLVYVPGASMTGISRKLPDTERNRLKQILKKVTPENAGVIVRTAAEGAAEAELDRDVTRLAAQWESIEKKAKTATAPALLYGEPDLTIRVVRDVFNEDFSKLIVSGDEGWDTIDEYVRYVAPHLADRLNRWVDAGDREDDVFAAYRIDEQLTKALERKVWLPSGGSLVIDRTEAMTVVDVNTGKFTGQGGNLEETVTRNNLEAAEEIVRQLRLRDVGGIVVIDFIDMVLESNRELVLRRLLECLARDRTKHQVAEVTSLGLVQMTRKRVGAGLLEAFSQPCECCNGRGVIITLDQPEPGHRSSAGHSRRPGSGNGAGGGQGNGQGGRPGQDRSWQDRPESDRSGSDRAGSDRPGSDSAGQDSPAQDRPARGEEGQRGRRGRRDGRTNGGTASASVVRVAEAPPAASPVPVVNDDVPPVVTSVTVEATTTQPPAPGRRTRAGSAMARRAVTAEDVAPVVTVTVPGETSALATDTASPADAAPVTDIAPVTDTEPVTDTAAPAEPASPADVAIAEDLAPAWDVSPADVLEPAADDVSPVDAEELAAAEEVPAADAVLAPEEVPAAQEVLAAEEIPAAGELPAAEAIPASETSAAGEIDAAEGTAPSE